MKAHSKTALLKILRSLGYIKKRSLSTWWYCRRLKVVHSLRYLEVIALMVGIPAALMFIVDLQDRRLARTHQAWEMLALQSSGSTGKADALEYLNLDQREIWRWPKKYRSNLTGVDLSSSREAPLNLGSIKLNHGILAGADFSNARLDYAEFDNATLTNVSFNGSTLVGASFLKFPELKFTSFLNTDLYGSDFTYAFFQDNCLIDVDFRSAVLPLGSFSDSLLFFVDFAESNLKGREFIRTNISGSNFAGANIEETSFEIHWGFDYPRSGDARKIEDVSPVTHRSPKPFAITAAWYWAEYPPSGLPPDLLNKIPSRPIKDHEALAIESLLQDSISADSVRTLCNSNLGEYPRSSSSVFTKALKSGIEWK